MMMKDFLITFGCSWTFGQGSGYQDGMTEDEYNKIYLDPEICWQNGWRRHVAEHFDLENINFGCGGSSNDKQFRLAKQFFASNTFKKIFQSKAKVYVLWGTTSVNRYDFWIREDFDYAHIFLKSCDNKDVSPTLFGDRSGAIDQIAGVLNKYSYYEPARVKQLELEFIHWNQYFKMMGIKNFWYDTFSSFRYGVNLPNFFDQGKADRRDMLATIVENDRVRKKSLVPGWCVDDFVYACDNNMLNPYTYHPKADGYKEIADHLISKLQEHIQ